MIAYNIAVVEDNLDVKTTVVEHCKASERLDCVLAVDSVEKFLKFQRDFMDIKLVLLDVMLHHQSSIYQIPHILQQVPSAEIIMFTVMDDSTTVFQAITYGATGYLLKDISMEELEQSLLLVLEGRGALISPAIARRIIEHFREDSKVSVPTQEPLSNKEHTVINMLNEGRTYDDIAKRLGITINGVRYYVKVIYRKLNVNSRGELLRKSGKEND